MKALASRLPLLLAATALSGCMLTGQGPRGPVAEFPAPAQGDGGIEIARVSMLPGATTQANKVGEIADCFGPGLGVMVESAKGAERLLFDAQGEPCGSASLLFDGSKATGLRQADPSVAIQVHDGFGMILDERPSDSLPARTGAQVSTLPPVPSIHLSSDMLPEAVGADPLTSTLNAWQRGDSVRAGRSAQSTEASTRELARMVAQAENTSSGAAAAALAAQLRDKERLLEDERRRHAESLELSAKNRAITQSTRDAWQQEQNRLQAELQAAKDRAAQFEQLASRLQTEKQRKEAAMGERIATLSGSLQLAEQQAEAGRRELILQAAAKVAEAQALATAARLDTQSTQLAEASRLHAQANELMDQVLLTRGEANIEPAAGPQVPELKLEDAPVVLQAKERTLPDILTEVLQQAAPHSGAWRAEWQLEEKGQALLAERWSLTAEATVGQILANLADQVQRAHGFKLVFTPFTQTRVLVITDGAKAAPVAGSR